MSTLKSIVDEVILEAKQESLKLFYDVDVFIQEFKDDKEETELAPAAGTTVPETPAPAAATPPDNTVPATAPVESFDDSGDLITEAIIKVKAKGELVVPKEDALNIQTVQDLIDYLSDQTYQKQSIVEKVLLKKGTGGGSKIISPEIQEIILILAGLGGEKELGDIVDKGDKIIVDIDYGTEKLNSIGFKINKNAGTEVFSIMMKKDGKILPGKFDQALLNKQILFYRNSLEG
jgi:hypothetical protein